MSKKSTIELPEQYFHSNLRTLRLGRNLTQKDLAELLGFKQYNSIKEYENASALPPFKKVLLIAKIFNVSLDDLIYKNFSDLDFLR